MKPAPFELHRPASLAEAVETVGAFGEEAKVLAGGQSLVPLLALRLVTPAHLVDLDLVEDLRRVEVINGNLSIGAMVRHVALGRDEMVRTRAPLVVRAVPLVGHAAIRNRGTFGGSLAHADPAAEHPAVCVALGATMELVGPKGTRRVPADEFFVSTFETVLDPDELLRRCTCPGRRAQWLRDRGDRTAPWRLRLRRRGVLGNGSASTIGSIEPASRCSGWRTGPGGRRRRRRRCSAPPRPGSTRPTWQSWPSWPSVASTRPTACTPAVDTCDMRLGCSSRDASDGDGGGDRWVSI